MCKRLFKALKIKMDNYKLRYELAGATETIEVLRKQLEEKEKEIEDMKIDLEAKDFNINTLMEQRKRKQKFYNQDKISFCIEQLEKVKELIKNMSIGIGIEIYGTRIKPVEEHIDNQIEELKKGSE